MDRDNRVVKGHIQISQNLYVPFKDILNFPHSQDLGLQWKATSFFKCSYLSFLRFEKILTFLLPYSFSLCPDIIITFLNLIFSLSFLCLYFIELCFIIFSLLFFIANNIILYFINILYWRTLRTLWCRSTWSKNQLFYFLIQ